MINLSPIQVKLSFCDDSALFGHFMTILQIFSESWFRRKWINSNRIPMYQQCVPPFSHSQDSFSLSLVLFSLCCRCSYFHVFALLCIDSYSKCCYFYTNQFFNDFTCQLPSHTIPKVAQLMSFSQ